MERRAAAVALVAAAVVAVAPVRASDNGLGRVPLMGWSTWCTDADCGRDYCTEDEVKSVALAMASNGMQALGWTCVRTVAAPARRRRTAPGSARGHLALAGVVAAPPPIPAQTC
jgi:hypothetical protein